MDATAQEFQEPERPERTRLGILYLDEVARIIHEVNRALCEAYGDTSQVPYDEAPAWQKESTVQGIRAMLDGTANSPEEQHAAWSKARIADGWVWGPKKDPATKQHDCLVPYAELPFHQKAKDYTFRAVVEAVKKI